MTVGTLLQIAGIIAFIFYITALGVIIRYIPIIARELYKMNRGAKKTPEETNEDNNDIGRRRIEKRWS